MEIPIHIPSPLRRYCDGRSTLNVPAATVGDALEHLERTSPDLYGSICTETGAVRRHVNLFVNSSLLDRGAAREQPLAPGDTLTVMPAVSGG